MRKLCLLNSLKEGILLYFKIYAPAKINLYLNIKGKVNNTDYHYVEMIMQSINLYDIITIKSNDHKNINIETKFSFCKNNENNTIYKAAKSFFEYSGTYNNGIDISVKKNIPISAGLAGGSADAAATIIGLNKMFKTDFNKNQLIEIALKVGADVPFCIFGGTMIAEGIGEILTPIKPIPKCYIVLCKPNIDISTKVAYKLFDTTPNKKFNNIKNIVKYINKENLNLISKNIYNRFEEVLMLDEVNDIKNILNNNGAIVSCMSGSGPSTYGIFFEKLTAKNCFKKLKTIYNDTFLCKPIPCGCKIIDN